MKSLSTLTIGAVVGMGITLAAVAYAQSNGSIPDDRHGFGPGMMHDMGPGMARGGGGPMRMMMSQGGQQDKAFGADMSLVHEMIGNHDRIKRTVTNLKNGIKTITESDDPQTTQAIKAHVASMEQRLKEGRVFNLFSPTLPVLFKNKDKIQTKVETTERGVVVTQTSDEPAVVTALQAHAVEVSELARDGMVAMMRGMRARMGMMQHSSSDAPPTAMSGL